MKSHLIKKQLTLTFIILMVLISPLSRANDIPIIAAASSIKFALQDISQAFNHDTGKTIRISYSSSGNLTRQIIQGAPFQLFLSANNTYIDTLYQQQIIEKTGTIFALGRLVLLSKNNSPTLLNDQLQSLKQALLSDQIKRFAIANPTHAPYGVAAQETLQNLKLWHLVEPHLVLGENAAQATQFISSGAAQAGLISYALALTPQLQKTTRFLLIPNSLHRPLKQSMVLLNNAGNTAKLFFKYLQQDKAQSILSHYGYSKP